MAQAGQNIGYEAKAVTTSDTLQQFFDGFFTTGAGNVTFKNSQGDSILLTAVPIFTVIPVKTSYIMATGTTSTGIVGLA
jgi:hypothetical protein